MTDQPNIVNALLDQFPDLSIDDLKAAFLRQAYGPIPKYSSLTQRHVHDVKTATVGSCVFVMRMTLPLSTTLPEQQVLPLWCSLSVPMGGLAY